MRCDLCAGGTKPGYLWLGGSDYVECPQCAGDRQMDIVEQIVTPSRIFAVTR